MNAILITIALLSPPREPARIVCHVQGPGFVCLGVSR